MNQAQCCDILTINKFDNSFTCQHLIYLLQEVKPSSHVNHSSMAQIFMYILFYTNLHNPMVSSFFQMGTNGKFLNHPLNCQHVLTVTYVHHKRNNLKDVKISKTLFIKSFESKFFTPDLRQNTLFQLPL
jgi:hypothetical protein